MVHLLSAVDPSAHAYTEQGLRPAKSGVVDRLEMSGPGGTKPSKPRKVAKRKGVNERLQMMSYMFAKANMNSGS